jgi:exopolyphosphatase/guanosine-5'-triphosphate,3'-diphosphate pyrophosphatase
LDEREIVAGLLGRVPSAPYEVVVRDEQGGPLVLRNAPLLEDGTPMPTRYWLVGRAARLAVDRLESAGGARAAEEAVDPVELELAHERYAAERDGALPPGWAGPRPTGGVGGTRRGVKCLHAHYAWYLAGGDDPVGRWVAEQLGEGADGAVAAVDCGTLSTRLLVRGPGGRTLSRLMRITRLGEGVDASGYLLPEAAERTLEVLGEYRGVMDQLGAKRARMVGTSALRDAANRASFSQAASEVIGTALELISGDEEAALSFAGATAELGTQGAPWLVVDIGGGSTELAVGPGAVSSRAPIGTCSLELGCVRVTERFLRHDPPPDAELREAASWLEQRYKQAEEKVPALRSARSLVGLAGTVSALASFDQGLTTYQREAVHHYRLRRAAVEEALRDLASQPAPARAGRPGIEPGRAHFIVGGTLVLATLMAHFGHDECLVSESDILDGLALSLGAGRSGR